MKKLFSALVISSLVFASASVFAADATPKNDVAAKPAVAQQQEAVNINTADALTLTKLKGIGPKKAEAVVAYRKANGNFKSVDQLAEVKGIGQKTVEANRKNIRI